MTLLYTKHNRQKQMLVILSYDAILLAEISESDILLHFHKKFAPIAILLLFFSN